MKDYRIFLPFNVHVSWELFLEDKGYSLLDKLVPEIIKNKNFTPNPDRVLHFLTLDLDAVKVLILGQDPYPQEGIATGRAFEVGPLKKWTDPFRNTSLRNIVRALYDAECNEKLNFKEILVKLTRGEGEFKLLEPNNIFKYWENQGVLLINTSFTCELGKPGSHSGLWRPFTLELLHYINRRNPDIYWLLWGNHAKETVSDINIKNKFVSSHPMICCKREGDFLYGKVNHFKATKTFIDWTGKESF